MHRKLALSVMICLALLLLALPLAACAPAPTPTPTPTPPVASLEVDPSSLPLSIPAVMGTPITFTGSGWTAGEIVAIDLVVPPDVEITGVEPGENAGIAFTTADENGAISTAWGTLGKIYVILRSDYDLAVGPIWSGNPIPAGVYTIKATGATSGAVGTTTIEFVTPAE